MKYRGEKACIFNSNEHAGDYCQWNNDLFEKSSFSEGYERLDICKLCQSHDTLKSVSFVGTLLKETKDILRELKDIEADRG